MDKQEQPPPGPSKEQLDLLSQAKNLAAELLQATGKSPAGQRADVNDSVAVSEALIALREVLQRTAKGGPVYRVAPTLTARVNMLGKQLTTSLAELLIALLQQPS